jgi:hypothetical protein
LETSVADNQMAEMKRIRVLIVIAVLSWVVYLFAGTLIGNALLKNTGKCRHAILISEQNRVGSQKATSGITFLTETIIYCVQRTLCMIKHPMT